MNNYEELELHLRALRDALDAEVEAFGSRTRMAYALRLNIQKTEQELAGLKTDDVPNVTPLGVDKPLHI